MVLHAIGSMITPITTTLNNSKFFAALVMILLNIGSKYVNLGLTKSQEEYLRHSFLRYLLIFGMCWAASRDIFLTLIFTAIICVSLDYLLNEKSKLCIIPLKYRKFKDVFDTDGDGVLSEEEIKRAEEVILRAKKEQRKHRMVMHLNYIKNG
tara:strand:- start:119 stop:574 length:456 start_codon:yes stop_codon:yes gene_type:complete